MAQSTDPSGGIGQPCPFPLAVGFRISPEKKLLKNNNKIQNFETDAVHFFKGDHQFLGVGLKKWQKNQFKNNFTFFSFEK